VGLIHGEVHDPNAWAIGGVAGHAGLFSSVYDLAIFAQMMLNGGFYDGVRILRPQTIARWTAPQVPASSRALGWDTPSDQSSAGRFFGPRSFGHTGYTGTSMWVDPDRGLFVILLTNRVNPTSENMKHVPLRRAVADAVQAAIMDAPLIDWEARRRE
jgi:CubicO group peptidase (beta-lactamase class C family)